MRRTRNYDRFESIIIFHYVLDDFHARDRFTGKFGEKERERSIQGRKKIDRKKKREATGRKMTDDTMIEDATLSHPARRMRSRGVRGNGKLKIIVDRNDKIGNDWCQTRMNSIAIDSTSPGVERNEKRARSLASAALVEEREKARAKGRKRARNVRIRLYGRGRTGERREGGKNGGG